MLRRDSSSRCSVICTTNLTEIEVNKSGTFNSGYSELEILRFTFISMKLWTAYTSSKIKYYYTSARYDFFFDYQMSQNVNNNTQLLHHIHGTWNFEKSYFAALFLIIEVTFHIIGNQLIKTLSNLQLVISYQISST